MAKDKFDFHAGIKKQIFIVGTGGGRCQAGNRYGRGQDRGYELAVHHWISFQASSAGAPGAAGCVFDDPRMGQSTKVRQYRHNVI